MVILDEKEKKNKHVYVARGIYHIIKDEVCEKMRLMFFFVIDFSTEKSI